MINCFRFFGSGYSGLTSENLKLVQKLTQSVSVIAIYGYQKTIDLMCGLLLRVTYIEPCFFSEVVRILLVVPLRRDSMDQVFL